jgi:hypothetical protein
MEHLLNPTVSLVSTSEAREAQEKASRQEWREDRIMRAVTSGQIRPGVAIEMIRKA